MECDGCTLCCRLFDIHWLEAPPNVECKHCILSKGCAIHEKNKPEKCVAFDCAYAQGTNLPISLRPDNCHVIFEKISDKLFIGSLDARYEMTDVAKGQIMSFLNQGFSVILGASDYREPLVFIASGHNKEEILNDGNLRDRFNHIRRR